MKLYRKVYNRKKADDKGFTLVELIIVVAILAVLVGMLAPQYTKYVEKSRKSADVSNIDKLIRSIETAAADPDYYTMIVPNIKSERASYYVIKVTNTGMEIAKKDYAAQMPRKMDLTANLNLFRALNEYYGNEWKKLTMKSTRWGECKRIINFSNNAQFNNIKNCITIEIKVTDMGQVIVQSYQPEAFAEAMSKKTTQS